MRILKLLTLVGLISTIYPGNAQNSKQANIWYFGINAGVDFTNGNPVAITNGALEANEGVATMSDRVGNLLFYTNGGDVPNIGAVWNRNHQVMPNGFLNNNGGCSSSIQSSLAIQKPGNPNSFYLFSTDCLENALEGGLSYSIIDMNLDGGLGDVVVKGVELTDKVTESLSAVGHTNGRDYWIITHKVNTDSFYVYQLTVSGISGVVKSKVGPVIDQTAGEIKASANGQRIVYCGNQSYTGLYDFDAETGVVSNYRNLNIAGYTACFSPNCEFLYITEVINRTIYQYHLIPHDVALTKVLVGTSSKYLGTLQLGPDDKMYLAQRNSQYLGVITRPNIKGVNCNFVEQGVFLGGKISKWGLPNYANDVLGECVPYPVENVSRYDFEMVSQRANNNGIVLRWDNSDGAESYRIGYRKSGEKDWNYITAIENSASLSGLDENSEYEFKLHSITYQDGVYEPIYNHNYDDVVYGKSGSDVTLRASTSDNFSFDVFPNPVREKAVVRLNLENNSTVETTISDLNGKVIFLQKWNEITGALELPVSNLPNGIYHLTVKAENMSGNRKIIVMN